MGPIWLEGLQARHAAALGPHQPLTSTHHPYLGRRRAARRRHARRLQPGDAGEPGDGRRLFGSFLLEQPEGPHPSGGALQVGRSCGAGGVGRRVAWPRAACAAQVDRRRLAAPLHRPVPARSRQACVLPLRLHPHAQPALHRAAHQACRATLWRDGCAACCPLICCLLAGTVVHRTRAADSPSA